MIDTKCYWDLVILSTTPSKYIFSKQLWSGSLTVFVNIIPRDQWYLISLMQQTFSQIVLNLCEPTHWINTSFKKQL